MRGETTEMIFVVENISGSWQRNADPCCGGRVKSEFQIAGVSGGLPQAGASAAKREVRVFARGRSSNHATSRSRFIAAAVATCCKEVFSRPRYLAYRSPKLRTPWDSVPSTPARRLSPCFPSSLAYQARAASSASYCAWGAAARDGPAAALGCRSSARDLPDSLP